MRKTHLFDSRYKISSSSILSNTLDKVLRQMVILASVLLPSILPGIIFIGTTL